MYDNLISDIHEERHFFFTLQIASLYFFTAGIFPGRTEALPEIRGQLPSPDQSVSAPPSHMSEDGDDIAEETEKEMKKADRASKLPLPDL